MTVGKDKERKLDSFKYFGSFIQKNGDFDKNVKHWIRCGWMKHLNFRAFREFQ